MLKCNNQILIENNDAEKNINKFYKSIDFIDMFF